MTTSLYKKGIVLGIICLFIGAGIVPSITGKIEQTRQSTSSVSFLEEELENKFNSDDDGNNIGTLDITSNLKGYWSFDDSITDGYVSDSSGNGKTGTIYGDPQKIGHQDYGDALEFDGANDFIDLGDDSHFDITGDITIALWFKTDTIQRSGLVTKLDGGDPDNGYCLMMSTYAWNPAGTISFKLAYQSSGGMYSYDVFTTSTTFTDDNWHHLAAIYTPNGVSRPKIYIDGSEQPGSPYGHALSAIGASPGWNFRIAAGYGGGDRFNGAIDEVRIYDRALSPSDITELYDGGGGNYYPIADTHINHRIPDTNYGSDDQLEARNEYGSGGSSGWAWDSLIRFDLSSIPSGSTISSAYLKIYYYHWYSTNPQGRSIKLYRATDNWNENIVTWNNQPPYSPQLSSSTNVPSNYGWMSWDVTNDIQDFIDGSKTNYGWKVTDNNYWGDINIPEIVWHSKEYSNSNFYPYLEIQTTGGNQPPTVEITYPEYGKQVTGTVTIQGTANDPGGTVELVQVKIRNNYDHTYWNGNCWIYQETWNDAIGKTVWSYSWNTAGLDTGTYNISARSKDNEDVESDEFLIRVIVCDKGFFFVHITDPHVIVFGTDRWDAVRNEILSWSDKPKFVLCTGDLVEWGAGVSGHANFWAFVWGLHWTLPENWYLDSDHKIPICFCPGNHDSRFIYECAPPYSLVNYQLIVNLLLDYSTIIGNCAIFSLNSGSDCWPWGGFPWPNPSEPPGGWPPWKGPPEGDGLGLFQLAALKLGLDSLDGDPFNFRDDSDFKKIIILHHPNVNPGGGNGDTDDGVFWNYRDEFKQICNQYDVDLVMFGHLHTTGEWDLDGNDWSPADGPHCILTRAIKDTYTLRTIRIEPSLMMGEGRTSSVGSEIIVEDETYLKSTINLYVSGRCEGCIYDDKENYAGVNETGGIEIGIPGACYSRWIFDNETLGINETYTEMFVDREYSSNSDDVSDYRFVIESHSDHTMNLTVEVHLMSGVNAIATYENVALFDSSVATLYANNSIVSYTLIVNDPDGTTRYVTPTNYEGNLPPETPNRPDGPSFGRPNREYSFETATIDPDYDNQLHYMWDWGDGTNSGWLGPYNSGETATASHIWTNGGEYEVKVKAKDVYGYESNRSKSLTVHINSPPEFGTPTPVDGATNQPVEYLTWSIPISDPEGDLFDWSIACSNGQTISGVDDTNGTKEIHLGGLEYNTEYSVWVNATDPEGSGLTTEEEFTFTTHDGPPPIVYVDDNFHHSTSGFGIDHFIRIQHGVDHVEVGGTVNVYDGYYSEPTDVISIDKQGILIQGIGSPAFGTSGAIIEDTVQITANDITFTNFIIQPSEDTPALTIEDNVDASTITVQHNKFLKECISNAIGIENKDTYGILDARYNYGGAPDGPSGLVIDSVTGRKADGFGVEIVDNGPIMFDPWAGIDAEATVDSTAAEQGTSIGFDASQSFACHLDGTPNDFDVFWDFDDGTYSTNLRPKQVFDSPGTYDVTLRVEAIDTQLHSGFMYDWDNITINIFEEGTPLACNADGENLGGYNGMRNTLIQFYGTAVGGIPPYTYQWSFGDNTGTVTGQNPTHKYTDDGTYTVSLTVVDNSGGIATDTADVTVNDVEPLEVEISESTSNLKVGETVSFTGNVDGGLTPYTYTWNFGDNTQPVNSKNTEHTYNTEGTYTVTLIVTDYEETIATDTATITVTSESDVEEVEILGVKAGYLLSATIKAGDNPVDWTISIDGRVFIGGQASGNIAAHATETVKLPFSLGIGRVDITVTANSVTKEATAFMLGPFVLSVEEI